MERKTKSTKNGRLRNTRRRTTSTTKMTSSPIVMYQRRDTDVPGCMGIGAHHITRKFLSKLAMRPGRVMQLLPAALCVPPPSTASEEAEASDLHQHAGRCHQPY